MRIWLYECALVAALVAGLAWLFGRRWRRPSRTRLWAQRLALGVCTLLLGLLLLEGWLALGPARPDAWLLTRDGQQWMRRHWQVNSQGFRDREHPPAELDGRRVLLVLGDSVAAGAGVADPEQRFADRLQRRLGDRWRVVNRAAPGWDTPQQAAALESWRGPLDGVLLAHFVNDIDHAAGAAGLRNPISAHELLPPPWLARGFGYSRVLERLYWGWRRRQVVERYLGYLERCHAEPAVWRAHVSELERLERLVERRGAWLAVVVFPMLGSVEQSSGYSRRVAEHFRGHGVAVLDLAPSLTGRPASELVAGPLDAHPNAELHGEVAERLARLLADAGLAP